MTRTRMIILSAVVVVLVAVGVGVFWFLRDESPDAVSLDAAVNGVSGQTTTTIANGGTVEPTAVGIAGTWAVDTTSGTFDFESATGTFVGFRIAENLAGIGSTTAVGRTGAVTGTMEIDGTTLTAASFDVDVSTITTNDSRRNDRVAQALESDQIPTATFKLTTPVDLGADAANGGEVSVTAVGDLTIHGVTKSVSFPLQSKLVNGTVVVVGSLDLTFSDFGVTVPKTQIVVSVDDHGTLELQLLLTRK